MCVCVCVCVCVFEQSTLLKYCHGRILFILISTFSVIPSPILCLRLCLCMELPVTCFVLRPAGPSSSVQVPIRTQPSSPLQSNDPILKPPPQCACVRMPAMNYSFRSIYHRYVSPRVARDIQHPQPHPACGFPPSADERRTNFGSLRLAVQIAAISL